MSQRRRFLFPTISMVLLAAAAVLLAIRFGWFRTETPPVLLPDTTAAPPPGAGITSGDWLTAEVTVETVQAVVGTLARPDSYSRTLRVESFWEGGGQSWNVQVWQKSGATRIRMETEDGSQPVRNLLVTEDSVQIWYDEPRPDIATFPLSDPAMADTLQMLPTYETVRTLDPALIEEAGYVQQNGAWRILAVIREAKTGYRMYYYISIETGLLESAERWDGGRLLYRMTAETAELAAPADHLFQPGS